MTKDEKKIEKKRIRSIKKDALIAILTFVKENTDNTNLIDAVTLLTPGQHVQRTNSLAIVADILIEQGSINEMDLFTNYRLGRSEMRKIMRGLIRKVAPESRIWIKFDPETGVYELIAEGADAPEGWTGYMPITIQDMEIE